MTWTWTEIISLALVQSGNVGLGQIATAQQASFGMKRLNLLLDELDGEGLALPAFDSDITFDTTAGVAEYGLGPDSGSNPVNGVRPETIVTGTCVVSTGPTNRQQMVEMSYPDYTLIPVPSSPGVPWNYVINPTWPNMLVSLYPTPAAVYPIVFTCKIKWIDTVGEPSVNPFSVAEVPSGYASGLVELLTLKLAEANRLDTDTMRVKAANARYMMTSQVYNQNRSRMATMPMGIMPWNTGKSGLNPWQ